ncbi:hypothetical protein TNCT_460971 [Trichonephila clavata]|uniref:Uncharacterized protein n=1 Tax=Trichonephila clavata TaxID=2740835 RepID=A0A8X6F7H2_TRICU|nr:hypothetical protein TNCT_460971 [Trichonephila clavata]
MMRGNYILSQHFSVKQEVLSTNPIIKSNNPSILECAGSSMRKMNSTQPKKNDILKVVDIEREIKLESQAPRQRLHHQVLVEEIHPVK